MEKLINERRVSSNDLDTNEVLRVTPDGQFIWHPEADNMIADGDFRFAPAMPHILRALREIEQIKARLKAVNKAAMTLTADLCAMEIDDSDRLDRDRVMERVTRWRMEWDKAMNEER